MFSEVDVQQTHWIRAKRLGYLVYRIGYFFHDKTMDLKFASRKVRQLIDKYVKSEGVDTKFSQMEIMSEDFVKMTENLEIGIKKKSFESLLEEIKLPGEKYAVNYLTASIKDFRKMKKQRAEMF